MRLTNTIREAFVNAALDDVPSVDYQSMISKLALDDAISQMPATLQRAYKVCPEYFENKGKQLQDENGRHIGWYYGPWGNSNMTSETRAKIVEANALMSAQSIARYRLKEKLSAVAHSTTTRKGLVELLPGFEKYLPEEAAPLSRMVPAVANVLEAFVDAGWPKEELKTA